MSSETQPGPSGDGSSGKFVPPSTADLDAVLDQYEFIGLIGRGGMGAVYRARQKSLDREVAIKILPPDLADDGDGDDLDDNHFSERFQREARAMAKLSHPNIIAVYDFGQTTDGQLYIVMEFVEGTDLHALIQTGQLTSEHVLGWTPQICDALQYAHNQGIIHRDIKPANIMISQAGEVKIADFGLAKLTGAGEIDGGLTMTNMAMGTPDYIAPEALEQGAVVDHRADLYAVGVMLYEMFTGKVPRGAWKAPSTQVQGLDQRYDALIERAMDSDREGRFQNATEISASLYEISTTRPESVAGGRPKILTGAPGTVGAISADGSDGGGAQASIDTASESPAAEKTGKPVGLIVGIVAATLAISAAAFFLLKSDPADESIAAIAETPDSPLQAPDTDAVPDSSSVSESPAPSTDDPPVTPPPPSSSAPDNATATPPLASTNPPDPGPMPAPATTTPAPPSEDSLPIAPAGAVIGSEDLLPMLSMTRDTLPENRDEPPSGLWKAPGGKTLSFAAAGQSARIAAPVSLSNTRDCEIEFLWKGRPGDSEGCLALDVPIAEDQWVRVKIGVAGDRVDIGQLNAGVTGSYTQNGSGMRVVIRRIGTSSLVVSIDGREVARVVDDLASHAASGLQPHPLFAGKQLPVLAASNGNYTVLEWTVRTFDGELTVLEDPRVSDDVRLTQLETGFHSAFERDANQPFLSALAALDQNYANALERTRRGAQQRGALDDLVALRKEQQRIAAGNEMPETDPADTPAALITLRATYRGSRSKLETDRDAKTIPLYDKYLGALTAYEAELTQGDDINKALAIRDFRKLIVARRSELIGDETPTAASDPASVAATTDSTRPATPPSVPDGEPVAVGSRRELAAWLLSIGAKFTVYKDDQRFDVSPQSPGALPDGAFTFSRIEILDPPESVSDQDYHRLGAATKVEALRFFQCKFSTLPALRSLTQLREVDLIKCHQMSDEILADLATLPALERVDFYNPGGRPPPISDEGAAALANSRSLKSLRIENVAISDAALAHFGGIASLEKFTLQVINDLDGSFLTGFAGHPSLSEAVIWHLGIEKFDGSHLAALETAEKLRYLKVSGFPVDEDAIAAIGKLKQLTRLGCSPDPSVDDEELSPLANLPLLTDLDLPALQADGTCFANFQCGPTLTVLAIHPDAALTDEGLAAIAAGFPNLENLNLQGTNLGSAGIESLSSLQSLTSLTILCSPEIGGGAWRPLVEAKSLRELAVLSQKLDAEALGHLAEIRDLQMLSLQGCEIDSEGFAALANMRKLQTLHIHHLEGGFRDEWIPTIKQMRGLKTLNLYKSGISADDGSLQRLQAALPNIRVEL